MGGMNRQWVLDQIKIGVTKVGSRLTLSFFFFHEGANSEVEQCRTIKTIKRYL